MNYKINREKITGGAQHERLDWSHRKRGLAFLSRQSGIDEVDFWQAGAKTLFLALKPGGPFLFKLHAPHPLIVVGG